MATTSRKFWAHDYYVYIYYVCCSMQTLMSALRTRMAALSIVPILSALMCAAVTLDTVWMLTDTLVTVSTYVIIFQDF